MMDTEESPSGPAAILLKTKLTSYDSRHSIKSDNIPNVSEASAEPDCLPLDDLSSSDDEDDLPVPIADEDVFPPEDGWDYFFMSRLEYEETKMPMAIYVSLSQHGQKMKVMVSQRYGDKYYRGEQTLRVYKVKLLAPKRHTVCQCSWYHIWLRIHGCSGKAQVKLHSDKGAWQGSAWSCTGFQIEIFNAVPVIPKLFFASLPTCLDLAHCVQSRPHACCRCLHMVSFTVLAELAFPTMFAVNFAWNVATTCSVATTHLLLYRIC